MTRHDKRREPKADGGRAGRVAERIREELAELFLRGVMRDPAARDVVVSVVRVTDDLQFARVYVRRVALETTTDEQAALVTALTKVSPFLQRELRDRMGLRRTPELRFEWDEGQDHAARIETLLDEIRLDATRRGEGEG